LIQKKTTELLTRGIEKIINKKDLDSLLKTGKPLRLKMGFDPSKPDIHLGHVVGLRKLREFQEFGHQVILIVGDWTAQIGDPSGQSSMRSMLTRQEVLKNANSYMEQFFSIVDERKTEVSWQSKWFEKFGLEQVFDLTSRFTVAQFLARSDFSLRFNNNKPIAITEFLYPLMQAYDSVAIKSDVEFGGTDQEFNLLVGRDLQTMFDQKPQQCILMPILVGLDGVQKMSKSLNNYIAVNEAPADMFGKIMSIPDTLMHSYFLLLTNVSLKELNELFDGEIVMGDDPISIKKRLAFEIVKDFFGLNEANNAQNQFESVIQRKEIPDNIPVFYLNKKIEKNNEQTMSFTNEFNNFVMQSVDGNTIDTIEFLIQIKFTDSKSEAKRILQEGSFAIVNSEGKGEKISDRKIILKNDCVFRLGSRKMIKIIMDK
tara:strand:+ start:1666 stop:2949 length:1284 start_codon:yes stop_codon:yes gene_type:complete